VLIALLIANTFARAQNPIANNNATMSALGETLYVHANTTTVVTGETLYCKLYCLNPSNNTPSTISKIAYIELIEKTQKSVLKQKLYLDNGKAQGDFFIPTTLKTGNYKLIAYTKWMLNYNTSSYFEMDITIINPFQPLDPENIAKNDSVSEEVSLINPEIKNEGIFSILTDKKNYSFREKVNLKIQSLEGTMQKGSYSVSVRKTDALSHQKQANAKEFVKSKESVSPAKTIFLPELRGELLSGSIISKKGKELNHKSVAISIAGSSFALKIAETDRLGKFTFILDKNPNLSNLVIQVLEEDRDDFSIILDESNTVDLSRLSFLAEFLLSPKLKNAIEERSVANQIENAYYAKKKDSITTFSGSDSFFHPLEKVYVLDDYTRFPTMKETITEIVLEMYYKKDKNKYAIFLRNYAVPNMEVYGAPLLLIDGLLIQDANELFDYNIENINKISLINEPYVYGPKTFGGVINITTKNQDYETRAKGDFIKNITIPRPVNQKNYYQPDYAAGNFNSRIPDYRQQLLWLPETKLDNLENTISFYTSDIAGKFEITVEGFTDTGIPVSIKDSFEVNNAQ